ncbi:ABC transporter substrate-binding protein [Anaerovorax sp. IOR16]|uniref:ABC transporter substrate-binding protein n=1 Tax=Anaerovorax sp. IOR16 TaxID=2773458 RepID=UPI0019D24654|nr:ABC transporter substrate-binding protein [Anaerovorax sp. IOR16]
MKKVIVILLVIALCFTLGACNQNQPTDAGKTKTLNAATYWMSDDAEPTKGWNGWVVARFGAGENLVQLDENMRFKEVIAESWKQIDELTTVFTIREGIKFHNGNPVDAKACKESIERALEITDREDVKLPIDSITAEGQKLTIKTSQIFPTLINLLADPVYIIVDASADDGDNFAFQPICTGPFQITEYQPDVGLKLKKNENYWKCDVDVDTIDVKLIADTSARAMALQSGEVDFATALNRKDLGLFEGNEEYVVQRGPNLRVAFLAFNMKKPYMQNLEFRQALTYGIDKKTYAKELYDATMAKGPFNESLSFGYKGEDYYSYDPDKARELLDKVGFVDTDGDGIREMNGKNIVLQFATLSHFGRDAANTGVAMQSQYKEIGLGLEITQYENLSEIADSDKVDIIWDRWTSAPTADPQYLFETAYKTGSPANRGNYSNKEFDAVCEELKTTFGKGERDKLGIKGSEILMKDAGVVFLFYLEGSVVTRSNVEGIHRFVSDIYHIDERVKMK